MTAKTLLIVESPAKAKTLSRYLGREYEIKASVGHVRDLPKKRLAVDVDNGFEPTYEVAEGKAGVVREMQQLAEGADRVILATDPDREGEAIAYHVAHLLGYGDDPSRFGRVRFREVTKRAVTEAVAAPSPIDFNRVHAQQARRVLDRLVGYKVSGRLPRGQSAGRVQTVALRLVCEREDAIRAFTPTEHWSITAHLRSEGKEFTARLHQIDGKKVALPDEATAQTDGKKVALPDRAAARRVVDDLDVDSLTVTALEQSSEKSKPPAPFTTSTLQQQAANRHGLRVKRTMSLAQALYEGLPVGSRGRVGLITYMRTDSTRVAPEAANAARSWIGTELGEAYLPARPRLYGKAKSQAQDAHEAIRPTHVDIHPEEARRYLNDSQAKLYELIWKRFVASQINPAIYDKTVADFDLERARHRYRFRATGRVLRFDGFKRLDAGRTEPGDKRGPENAQPLPPLEEQRACELRRVEPKQHHTKPPPRYTEASLVKKMEKVGIGRPSTYAQILSRIVDVGYVDLEKRRFVPTPDGNAVAKLLVRVLPETFDVKFTSRMESRLDRIENGEEEWRQVLSDFYPPFQARLDRGVRVGEHPDGNGTFFLRIGRHGPYLELDTSGDEKGPTKSVPTGIDPSVLDATAAARLFELPRELGQDPETGEVVSAGVGRSGPFVRKARVYADLPSIDDVWTVTCDEALARIAEREGRALGTDPETGNTIRLKKGRFGHYVEEATGEKKPPRASLPAEIEPTEVDLELAIRLLGLPRALGSDPETGEKVEAGFWRGRPAVRSAPTYADLPAPASVWSITLEAALTLLANARTRRRASVGGAGRPLKELGPHPNSGKPVVVRNGRYGPYVTDGTTNASLPKGSALEELDLADATELLRKRAVKRAKKRKTGSAARRTGRKPKTSKPATEA